LRNSSARYPGALGAPRRASRNEILPKLVDSPWTSSRLRPILLPRWGITPNARGCAFACAPDIRIRFQISKTVQRTNANFANETSICHVFRIPYSRQPDFPLSPYDRAKYTCTKNGLFLYCNLLKTSCYTSTHCKNIILTILSRLNVNPRLNISTLFAHSVYSILSIIGIPIYRRLFLFLLFFSFFSFFSFLLCTFILISISYILQLFLACRHVCMHVATYV